MTAFCVMSMAWSITGLVLYRLLPRHLSQAIGPRLVTAFCRSFVALIEATGQVRCDLGELDGLRDGGGMVLAANHPSLIDAVLIISRLPRVVCIAKAGLWDNPLFGSGMRMAGYIRNDAPIKLVKVAVERLRHGRQLLLFPEGTRTATAPLDPLKGGFAVTAKHAGVPVQTVLIDGNTRFLGKGWPILRRPALPLVYRVRLGRRFEPQDEARALTATVERYFRDQLASADRAP